MPEIVNVNFGSDEEIEIEHFIHQQLEALERSHKDLHDNRIPRWRKLYEGIPNEETKSFPWPNAANTIVQVVGETVDTAVARVLGLVWATHPLWAYQNYNKDPRSRKDRELRRRTLEDFMDIVGNQPNFLDLYRVEGQWFTDIAKLGTAFVKVIIDKVEEAVVVGYDSSAKKIAGKTKVLYDGPRVEKLRHEDVMLDPRAQTVDRAHFISHRRSLYRTDLEERAFFDIYDKAAVESILDSPDRSTPPEPEREELQDKGITSPGMADVTAEWDVYECHFPWLYNGRKYRLIYTYHKKSRTVLRKIFNFMPDNRCPIIRGKLGYREDGMYGNGYAYLLERYQEELSSIHNQRSDNATMANIRALRISPRARALDSNFELYPGALLVAEKDDIEAIQVGDVYPSSFQGEEVTRALVQSRSGITPAQTGAGTGGMTKKPAIYSSMGTLSVMQENNSRIGHATSEFRHAHTILGDTLTAMYAHFGVNGCDKLFGANGHYLLEALDDYKSDKLYIPIRSTTGSLNKEVEKQNAMLMKQLQERHFITITQMLQALSNPMTPPELKEKLVTFIDASNLLMQTLIKDFGYDQPEDYIPDVTTPQSSQSSNQRGQMAPARSSMGAPVPSPAGNGAGLVPRPGGGGISGGSPQLTEPPTRPPSI